jgi:hypothetical protein
MAPEESDITPEESDVIPEESITHIRVGRHTSRTWHEESDMGSTCLYHALAVLTYLR